MPQVTYLVLQQALARMATPLTGFNALLAAACAAQSPQPTPYAIDFTTGSFNFWQSNISIEDLDQTSTPDGTVCVMYGVKAVNMTGTVQKYQIFSGTVQIAIDFEIAWDSSFDPSDTESLANATEDAMVQCFNAPAYYGSLNTNGVIWNGLIDEGVRGPLRLSGPGWRQKIPFVLTFEVQA
jgi:hypothetical protein